MSIMKTLLCVVLLCAQAFVGSASAAEKKPAALGPYLMVTEGIVGGIVAPHVRQRTIVIRNKDAYDVLVKTQPRRNAPATYLRGRVDAKEFDGLMKDIQKAGLFEFPLEKPRGGEDIYGLDTSIAVRSEKAFWRNGGPGGCVRLGSKVQPSDKQRKAFAGLVEKIKKFAAEHARKKGDADAFAKTVRAIQRDAPREKNDAGRS
jgi:hypothetical protein